MLNINRRQSGSAIVEGTVATIMLVAVVVGGVLLLVNLGLVMLYKEKLSFAANQCAQLAAGRFYWAGAFKQGVTDESVTNDLLPQAQTLVKALGLPSVSRFSVKCHADTNLTEVELGVGPFGLVGNMPKIIPHSITLADEHAVVFSNLNTPPALLNLKIGGSTSGNYHNDMQKVSVMIPAYGRSPDLPNPYVKSASDVPADTAALAAGQWDSAILLDYNSIGNPFDNNKGSEILTCLEASTLSDRQSYGQSGGAYGKYYYSPDGQPYSTSFPHYNAAAH